MTNYMRVRIGTGLAGSFTGQAFGNYAGDDPSLVSVRYKPAGPGVVGDATVVLQKTNGTAIDVKPKMQIYIGLYDGANWQKRLFAGFVKHTRAWSVKGTNERFIEVQAADMNLLADWLRIRAEAPGVTDSGAYDLDTQILNICRVCTYNSYVTGPTFDATTAVGLTGTMTGDRKYFSYTAKTLREMLNDRMAAYQADFSSVRPAWFFGLDPLPGTDFDSRSVQLNVYDEAAIGAASVAYTFSTAVAGDIREYTRNIDGIDIQTRVQAMAHRGTSGDYIKTETSTNTSTYPNDFDQRPFGGGGAAVIAWEGPVHKLADDSTTAAVDAEADKAIHSKENPRETLQITTEKADSGDPIYPAPGSVVTVTLALESLSAYRYRVSQVDTTWTPRRSGWWPVHTLTLGNKWLELGSESEDGTRAVFWPSVLDPPTDLSDPPTQTWEQSDLRVKVAFTFTPSLNPGVRGYTAHWMNGSYGWTQTIDGRLSTGFEDFLRPGLASTCWVEAYGDNGQRSAPTATVSFTTLTGSIDDTTMFALKTDSEPFKFYDDDGVERGDIRVEASTKTIYIRATHPGSDYNSIKLLADNVMGVEVDNSATPASRVLLFGAGDATNKAAKHWFTGGSVVTSESALSTSATDGFLYIPTCAGTPTGVPTGQTGTVALVYNTTGNELYVYNGGWKKVGLA